MTITRASLGMLLVAACSLDCSGNGTGNGTGPDNPSAELVRFAPETSRCIVGPGFVEIDVAMTVTFESDGTNWTEPYRWTFYCWPQGCEGTGLSRQPRSNAIESFPLTGARIVSVNGLVGTVQWRDSIFVVDAKFGRVTYTGNARHNRPGSGEAKCDDHRTPVPVLPKHPPANQGTTNETRT